MRPSKMMQQIAAFYRKEYPQQSRQEPPKDVLEVQSPDMPLQMSMATSICIRPCSHIHGCHVCFNCANGLFHGRTLLSACGA